MYVPILRGEGIVLLCIAYIQVASGADAKIKEGKSV